MSIIKLILFCAVAVVLAFFAVANRDMVNVTYFPGNTIEIALFVAVLCTLFLGIFVGLLLTAIPMTTKLSREKRLKKKAERSLKTAQAHIKDLENKQDSTIRNTTKKPTTEGHTLGDVAPTQKPQAV